MSEARDDPNQNQSCGRRQKGVRVVQQLMRREHWLVEGAGSVWAVKAGSVRNTINSKNNPRNERDKDKSTRGKEETGWPVPKRTVEYSVSTFIPQDNLVAGSCG